jgi:uncharacterized membrane protein YjgN (DUF898 family)
MEKTEKNDTEKFFIWLKEEKHSTLFPGRRRSVVFLSDWQFFGKLDWVLPGKKFEGENSMKREFAFNGKGGEYFSLLFIQGLLTIITFGIYAPWAIVKIQKYLAQNLTLEGKPFEFDGEGSPLFSLMFVQILLTIITFGIYYAWALIKIGKYMIEHTRYEGKAFKFEGEGSKFFSIFFVQCLLICITFGIYTPWALVKIYKYLLEKTSYDEKVFDFTAEGSNFFSLLFVQGLLTMITFGIYAPWAMAKIYAYLAKNVTYGSEEVFSFQAEGARLFSIILKGVLLTSITFGIYYAWYQIELMTYMAGCTALEKK